MGDFSRFREIDLKKGAFDVPDGLLVLVVVFVGIELIGFCVVG